MTSKTLDVASLRTRTADISRLSVNRMDATALSVSAPTTFMHFSNSDTDPATGSTSIGNGSANATLAAVRQPVPFAVEVVAVYAHAWIPPGAGESYTFSIEGDNGFLALSVAAIAGTSRKGSATGLALSIPAGENITISVTYSGGAAITNNVFSVSLALRPVQ